VTYDQENILKIVHGGQEEGTVWGRTEWRKKGAHNGDDCFRSENPRRRVRNFLAVGKGKNVLQGIKRANEGRAGVLKDGEK